MCRAEKRAGVSSFLNDDFRNFEDQKVSMKNIIAGHLSSHSSIRQSRIENNSSSITALIADKCSNPSCPSSSVLTLSACAGCGESRLENRYFHILQARAILTQLPPFFCYRYCSKSCQVSDWLIHKIVCKEIRQRKALLVKESVDAVEDALRTSIGIS